MKKLSLIILFFVLSLHVNAGDGDRYFNVIGGLSYKSTAALMLGLEFEGKYHNSWEIYVQGTTKFKKCEIEDTYFCKKCFFDYKSLSIGSAYKPTIYRWKNLNLRGRFGGDIGIDEGDSFYTDLELGVELAYTLKNRMKFIFTQKNEFIFWSKDDFRSGIYIGLALPLN